jgi:hypothetical protein
MTGYGLNSPTRIPLEGVRFPMHQSTLGLRLLLCGVVWIIATPAPAQTKKPATARPFLVSEIPCPDPYVVNDGSDWYIFGTGAKPFFLQGKELGAGKMRRVSLELDYAGFPGTVAQVWGFIVHRHTDGSLHGYGTLHLGHFHTVIAYFEPQGTTAWEKGQPITKWKFKRLLVGDPARKDWKYYESKILQGKDGTIYMMYVANTGRDNYIVAQKMKSLGVIDATSPRKVLLRPEGYRSEDRNGPKSMQLVEGGSIYYYNGKYILLYSVGDYLLNNYKLGMAFSDSLIPPKGQTYHKPKLPDPKRVWGSSRHKDEVGYLLQSEKPAWPNYYGGKVVGPGLGSLVNDGKNLWLFFHGYDPKDKRRNPENRYVYRVPVDLAIGRGAPSIRWLHANLSNAEPGPGAR